MSLSKPPASSEMCLRRCLMMLAQCSPPHAGLLWTNGFPGIRGHAQHLVKTHDLWINAIRPIQPVYRDLDPELAFDPRVRNPPIHHSWDNIDGFKPTILYSPNGAADKVSWG